MAATEPESELPPIEVLVQTLLVTRQISKDIQRIEGNVAALRADALPYIEAAHRRREAQEKAEAEAEAEVLTARIRLEAANVGKQAAKVEEETKKDQRVNTFIDRVTDPENVKVILRWMIPFLVGGGTVGGAVGGGSWITSWIQSSEDPPKAEVHISIPAEAPAGAPTGPDKDK